MEIKVSIIVPIYNAEKYLEECLESLVHQTFEEIEIILIDDASTDTSLCIMRKYQQMYPQKIKIIMQKENQKQGAARNCGVKSAVGKYVIFVDSDDLLDINAISHLYEVGERENCDIIFCDYIIFGDSIVPQCGQHVYSPYLGDMTIEKKRALLTTSVVPWAKLIRRNLLIENNILFPERCFYEDQATTYLFYLYAEKTAKVSAPFYKYRIYEHSTTMSVNSERHFQFMDMSLLLVERLRERGFENLYKEELVYFLFEQMYVLGICNCVKQFTFLPEDYIYALLKNFIEYCPDYNDNLYYCNYASERNKEILRTHQQSQSIMLKKLCATGFNNFCSNYMMSVENSKNKLRMLVCYIQRMRFKTAFWGAGKYALKLMECLDEIGYKFDYIIDQNPALKGNCYGKYVVSYFDVIPQISLIIIPYTQWSYSVKRILKVMKVCVFTIDLEIFIKHNLNIEMNKYLEKNDI